MTGSSTEELELDTAFELLADSYRRRLLLGLLTADQETEVSVRDIVEQETLEALRTRMRHSHLPKLEAAGVIRWDREANAVTRGPNFEQLRPLLQLMDRHAAELPEGWL
jgi:hypothetical protein